MNTEIYEHLLACCHRPTLGSRWSFITIDPDSGILTVEPPTILISLRNAFSLDELIEAKVAVNTEEDVKLNPVLITSDKLLVVLRDSEGQPFDVVTSSGTLHEHIPLFAVARDRMILGLYQSKRRRVFAVSTIEEMILYRSLQLPATLMDGLERLTGRSLGILLGLLDGAQGGRLHVRLLDGSVVETTHHGASSLANASNPKLTIVVAAFNLVTGKKIIPPQVFTVAQCMAGAAAFLNVQCGSLKVWWPKVTDRKNLAFRRRMRNSRLLREFLSSIENFHEVHQFVDPTKLPGHTDPHSKVQNKLLKAQQVARFDMYNQRGQQQYRAAFEEYVASIDRLLIKPMIERGEESENPSLQVLRLQLAGVSRALLMLFPSLHAAMEESLAGGPSAESGFLPASAWNDIKALSDQVTKIIQTEQRVANGK